MVRCKLCPSIKDGKHDFRDNNIFQDSDQNLENSKVFMDLKGVVLST